MVSLVTWFDILYEINIPSKILQSPPLDLLEVSFEKTLRTAKEIAQNVGIDDQFDNEQRSRRKATQFAYETVDSPINDPVMCFKVNFFNQVLDTAIQSITERFAQLSEHSNLFAFLYNISEIKEEDELLKHCKDLQLALTYNDSLTTDINAVELNQEIIAFNRRSSEENCDPRKVLEYIYKRKMVELFSNLVTALQILLTLPITAASAERSFSKLKIIKNYLRSQIGQIRLVGLAILSIENEVSNNYICM